MAIHEDIGVERLPFFPGIGNGDDGITGMFHDGKQPGILHGEGVARTVRGLGMRRPAGREQCETREKGDESCRGKDARSVMTKDFHIGEKMKV